MDTLTVWTRTTYSDTYMLSCRLSIIGLRLLLTYAYFSIGTFGCIDLVKSALPCLAEQWDLVRNFINECPMMLPWDNVLPIFQRGWKIRGGAICPKAKKWLMNDREMESLGLMNGGEVNGAILMSTKTWSTVGMHCSFAFIRHLQLRGLELVQT